MKIINKYKTVLRHKKAYLVCVICVFAFYSCVPTREIKNENTTVPTVYNNATTDTVNSAVMKWDQYFSDPHLKAIIDTALVNNQELNIMLQEVQVAKNEIMVRKGEYLPFVNIQAGAEVEKVGRYTSQGANDATTDIKEGEEFPEPLPNYQVAAVASWELDVWKKLRNSKKAAVLEYLASEEGKNFMVTNLVSEIASSYYELLALDNQLKIIDQNTAIQKNVLEIVKLQKQAARATELGVKRFEAEVLKNQSSRYQIQQQITEAENKICFLMGSYPKHIKRTTTDFVEITTTPVHAGIPSQLLQNRPDIKRAEYELAANKLNIKVAKANFYPSIGIKTGVGLEAFKPKFLTKTPESVLYNVVGDVVAPLINRNAIKAAYKNANKRQIKAVYEYEKAILNGYIETTNQLSNIKNLKKSFDVKQQEVNALTESIAISNKLFRSARADYMEVLLTQRDALEAKIELVETKKEQLLAHVNIYHALGGGWN